MRTIHIVRANITVERFLLPILREELKRGHEIDLAIGQLEGPADYCGITAKRFDLPRALAPFSLARAFVYLRRVIRENHYDAVLAHMPLAGFVGRVAAATVSDGEIAPCRRQRQDGLHTRPTQIHPPAFPWPRRTPRSRPPNPTAAPLWLHAWRFKTITDLPRTCLTSLALQDGAC